MPVAAYILFVWPFLIFGGQYARAKHNQKLCNENPRLEMCQSSPKTEVPKQDSLRKP